MEDLFCIKCQRLTLGQSFISNPIHEFMYIDDQGKYDIDWCDYPLGYAVSEPIVNPDWEIDLVEPSEEELEYMDKENICLTY